MNAIDGARRGAPARPTVICLHASGGSGTQWKMLADQMRHEFHVLTPDLYGHGMAAMWHGAPADIVAADAARIARLAADVAGDVHLVGHSYGGAIALRIALHHPASVASVAVYEPAALRILFDYNQKYRAAAEIAEVVGNIRHELNGGNAQRAALRFVDYWAGAGHWARLSPRQQTGIARRAPVIQAHFVALMHDGVRLRDYAHVDVPVLYLAGRDTRASARRIAELMELALPDVELEVLDGLGHLGPITDAERVAQRIASFVRRQTAARAAERCKAA